MIRKIFKWMSIVLVSLVGLLVLAFISLYIIGTVKWDRLHGNYDIPVETITIPTDQASIEHGKHVATIHICQECHTDNFSGQSQSVPGLITMTFPNLTPGAGGVGTTNNDEDWVRAIRHGVGHDGRGLSLMPSATWYYLSDQDLGALIAFLNSLPPVDNEMPSTALGPLGRVMLALGKLPPEIIPDATLIDHSGPRPIAPKPGVKIDYGKYLARTCALCHGANFNGQMITTDAEYLAPNLTPGGELHYWSEEDFMRTLRTGVTPGGKRLKSAMPWKYIGQMTDDEMKAVWMYVQSLPALPQGE